MRRPPNAGPGPGPAWNTLLLTGALLASCIRPASSELPASAPPDTAAEGAGAHHPVPRNRGGILSTSWSREVPGAQGSPVIRNVTAQDAGSSPAVLDPRQGRRSVTEQTPDKVFQLVLYTFPLISGGAVRSELNFSVILECLPIWITPAPLISWTFNGQPWGTGEKLIIRRLSREDLGSYTCTAKDSQGQPSSKSVGVSLPEADVDSSEEPVDSDPVLRVSGGPAIALLVAGCAGLVVVMLGIGSAIAQIQRSDRRRIRRCC